MDILKLAFIFPTFSFQNQQLLNNEVTPASCFREWPFLCLFFLLFLSSKDSRFLPEPKLTDLAIALYVEARC